MPTKARGSRTTEPHSSRDFVSDGVRLGYQVIDTYLKQGQKAARQFVSASNGGERGPGLSDESEIRAIQLFTELMANWSDLVGMFTETLNSAAGPLRAAERPQEPSPDAAASQPRSPLAVQLSYEITSRRPALVDVEFVPGRETPSLAAHGLRCLGSNAGEIAVRFEQQPDRQRTIVSIHVSDDQPAGLYTGTLMDMRDGSAVGVLSLRIR